MQERGYDVDHSTIQRWVVHYAPRIEKAFRKNKKRVGHRWRMDWSGIPETYIKIKGEWKYLYRAVDKQGDTIDFPLTARRDKQAARRFLNKSIGSNGNPCPMVSHPTQWLTLRASPCRQTLAGYRHQNAPGEGEMG